MPDQQRHTHFQPKNTPRQRRAQRIHPSPLRSSVRRRDGEQPRVINSREVRLSDGTGGIPRDHGGNAPHANISAATPAEVSEQAAHERSLRKDMAFGPKSRRAHLQRKRRRRRQIVGAIIVVCLVAIFGVGLLWMQRSNNLANAVTQHQATQQPAAQGASATATTTAAAAASTEPTGLPTPIVASFQNIPLHLSVRVANLTEVAFHPASTNYAMVLSTTLTPADATAVQAAKGTGRDKSKQPTGADAVLIGSYIQMWRTGSGGIPGLTAMDEGAPAGSVTYAPIDGTVTAVREYNYENGCKDYEVHISFADPALARYEVVMIHEENVRVKVGDKVVGGVTPIAQVRDLTPYLTNQLGEYTGEAGNHAHVQVNDTGSTSYHTIQAYREAHGYYIN